MVANPSVETPNSTKPSVPQAWNTGGYGTNSVSFTYDATTANSGSRSVRIDVRSWSSGDAKWIFDAVPVTPGVTYTYRDYYKATVATKIVASYTVVSGGVTTTLNQTLAGSVPTSTQWTAVAYALTPPAGTTKVTVFHLIAVVGTLQLDDVSLALPQVPNMSSGVPNGDLEQASDLNPNLPLAWTVGSFGTNHPVFSYGAIGRSGSHGLTIAMSNYTDGDAKWLFNPVAVTPGNTYIYRDYYQADSPTKIVAAFTVVRGTTTSTTYQTLANVVPANAQWTTVARAFVPPVGATQVSVYHAIATVGTLQLDDVSVAPPQTPNLSSGVPNGDFEQAADLILTQPLAWRSAGYGVNDPTFAYETTGHSGNRSVSVKITNYTNGDAKWYFDPQPVVPGMRYWYQDFYTATAASFITVRFAMLDGSFQYLYANRGNTPPTSGYLTTGAAVLAPTNATSITVFHGLARNGYLQIDDASLVQLPPATLVNGVPSGDFEEAAFPGAATPAGWYPNPIGENNASFSYPMDANTGNHTVRIDMSSYASGAASWYFDEQQVQAGEAYRVTETYRSDVDTLIIAVVTRRDGTSVNLQLPVVLASPDWATYTTKVYLPDDAVGVTLYSKLSSVGFLELDNVGFAPEPPVPFARGLVSFTFDDSWLTDYTNVYPVLAKHNVLATHYALSGVNGNTGRLTYDMLSELQGNHEQIAGHTVNHYDLTTLAAADLTSELTVSKQDLESNGLGPVLDFASPYGAYNAQVLAAAKQMYRSHRTVDAGYNAKDDWDIYRLKVQSIRSTTTVADVDGWAAHVADEHTWLILVYHDVVSDSVVGTQYSAKTADLDAQITAVQNRGLAIVTVQDALTELTPQLTP